MAGAERDVRLQHARARPDRRPQLPLTQPVFGQELLIAFESPPTFSGDMIGKRKEPNAFGTLAAYRLTEQGVEKAWSLPPEFLQHLFLDDGPNPKIVAGGLVYAAMRKASGADPKQEKGYQVPLLEPFANGVLSCRVWGGIRAYDLRVKRQCPAAEVHSGIQRITDDHVAKAAGQRVAHVWNRTSSPDDQGCAARLGRAASAASRVPRPSFRNPGPHRKPLTE